MTLRGVGHRFRDGRWLFRGVDARLERGVVHALVGPSGSGKSTLLGIIAGMVEPTCGHVERDDGIRVGWVFQNPHGVARRSVVDHVALPYLASGARRPEAELRAEALLHRFGLGSRVGARFRDLSGGEAQRLMLARAVASAPDVLLVDEPTAQLDRSTASQVDRAVRELAGNGFAVVVATHDPSTRASCDTVHELGQVG
ncbi:MULTISPECIES: ABC transporter ATP-binding protein [unclassified Curtobacterium]|uniref:ABC transporter ATP-binding protein n=1 Tax=unclassified Curtobacterium TaxID=257496 RepID=UPI000AC58D71|nr:MULTISPECIES: ATP-binding cassette domain-containing protein [unclassified Curtobacterium]WIA96848.1 ATP-binding cassette domain-containing protein [Curtobacterium sp. MCBA15_004]WIB00149.1 ATP-binding cassette domain-containing protein [Curtobacterium sp. MCBA15_012]